MCLKLNFFPQHPTWKTRICKNPVVQNYRRIHHRIQPHQLGAQRLDIFRNPSWVLWITPIWYAGKQTTQIEIIKERIFWSKNYPGSMETQMETYTILSSCGWLWSWICRKTTCRASDNHILKNHNITKYWEDKKYAGIDLKWDYDKITCRANMDGYILDLILSLGRDRKSVVVTI